MTSRSRGAGALVATMVAFIVLACASVAGATTPAEDNYGGYGNEQQTPVTTPAEHTYGGMANEQQSAVTPPAVTPPVAPAPVTPAAPAPAAPAPEASTPEASTPEADTAPESGSAPASNVADETTSAPETQTVSSGALPFTGFELGIALAAGLALVGTGLVLRRASRGSEA
jgi:hypothetical protein